MPSFGMLSLVALVRTDFSEELIAFIIEVKIFDDLRKELAVIMEATQSCESSVLARATRCKPQDGILQDILFFNI
jgi:hypothetical protein